jgi:fumarylpyruvate hydrolase
VGLDMTRRDLQGEMKKQGRPWEIGKAFEQSAPLGPIVPAKQVDIATAEITLLVNGKARQHGDIGQMIWSVAEVIAQLSTAWELYAGDLIYTGTPEGVAAVGRGDVLKASVTGLPDLTVEIV